MNILCLGAGFTGRCLWRTFADRHRVVFLSRSRPAPGEDGLPIIADSDWTRTISCRPIDAILDTVPAISLPGSEGVQDPPYLRQVDQVLSLHPSASYIHISSTSVYPGFREQGHSGRNIPQLDERAPLGPDSPRGRLRLLLEQRLARLYPRLQIVRSAGIYGPGRCLAQRFREGDFRRASEGNRVVSRIHVHDLCRLILAIAEKAATPSRNRLPAVVHAVDDCPAPNREVFEYLEQLLDIRIPGNWRQEPVRGRAIVSLYARDLLAGLYLYPSFREGFADCLAA